MLKQAVKRCGGLIDYINSQPGWSAITDFSTPLSVEEIVDGVHARPQMFFVPFYSYCDCGAPALEEQVLMSKELILYGHGYMETCYECGVVSSD